MKFFECYWVKKRIFRNYLLHFLFLVYCFDNWSYPNLSIFLASISIFLASISIFLSSKFLFFYTPMGQFYVVRMIHVASRLIHLSPQLIKKNLPFLGRVSPPAVMRFDPRTSRVIDGHLTIVLVSRWQDAGVCEPLNM